MNFKSQTSRDLVSTDIAENGNSKSAENIKLSILASLNRLDESDNINTGSFAFSSASKITRLGGVLLVTAIMKVQSDISVELLVRALIDPYSPGSLYQQ